MLSKAAILQLQKKIFFGILREIKTIEPRKSKEVRSYEARYKKEFLQKSAPTTLEKLISELHKCNLIFCADFHPFNQSQKTAIRLLRKVIEKNSNVILCLECVTKENQEVIDKFLAKKLSLEELRTHFTKFWPFPWNNYKYIFEFALEQGLKILAVNTDNLKSLQERDLAASTTLIQSIEKNPKSVHFVLYGELHLARTLLPKKVKIQAKEKKLPSKQIIVYQNEPSLYWKLVEEKKQESQEIFKLSKSQYCVINASPWIKAQSYLDSLEGNLHTEENEEDESLAFDALARISNLVVYLKNILNLDVNINTDINIYELDSLLFLKNKLLKIQSSEIKYFISRLISNKIFFLPTQNAIFLPSHSINFLAEAAVLLVRNALQSSELIPNNAKENISSYILLESRIYFGSKLINPKRKCNEIDDLKAQYQSIQKKNLSMELKFKKISLALAQKEYKKLFLKKSSVANIQFQSTHAYEAARIVGNIIGERLYYAWSKSAINNSFVQDLFAKKFTTDAEVKSFLKNLIKQINQSGYTITSKTEKL